MGDGQAVWVLMQALYWAVVVKKELNHKAKLLIYLSVDFMALSDGHELWVSDRKEKFMDTSVQNEVPPDRVRA